MKKLYLIALSVLAVSTIILASPGTHSVSTNAVTVLPARLVAYQAAWTNGTVAVIGDVFRYTDYQFYMAKVAGALPAAPTNTTSYAKVFSGARGFATVQNTGATDIWLAFGASAVLNSGVKLTAGTAISTDGYQGLISAISSATNGTVATTEVPKQ